MGLFTGWFSRAGESAHRQEERCGAYLAETAAAMEELMKRFTDRAHYIDPTAEQEWKARYSVLLSGQTLDEILKLKKAARYRELVANYWELVQCAKILGSEIHRHNGETAAASTEQAYGLIGPVEGHALDSQQMECIVKDVRNHLVIAGAGTGKTTVILGKIKYLLASGQCAPKDLLVLSYTNASASEMRSRIRNETGTEIAASTFHSLGLRIIREATGAAPKLTQLNLRTFVKDRIRGEMEKPAYLNLMLTYLLFYRIPAKTEFAFRTEQEYREFLACYPPKTLKQETVKSYAEMDIANFLTRKGISYRYASPYVAEKRVEEFGKYSPDFYLPDYDIYIEYFPLNRSGCLPVWYTGRELAGRSSLRWKRETHQLNGTRMIECYGYEKIDGTLLPVLEENLRALGVPCKDADADALWEELCTSDPAAPDAVADLLETMINLLKCNHLTLQELQERIRRSDRITENSLVFALLCPVYQAYCRELTHNGEIDFNDMINVAASFVRTGRWLNPYREVIVDEYQDISGARFQLLKEMRKSKDFGLFCVGDDWQSIYRFAGSDIGFILNFETHWGPSEISRIETTYRFSHELTQQAGGFVMKNPMQIRKNIIGKAESEGDPVEIITASTEKTALDRILAHLRELPKEATVFFIGRYGFDQTILRNHPRITVEEQTEAGLIRVVYASRPDLQISFLTAHKSKGLQADYVVILNNRNAKMGFPSKVQDAPVLGLMLDSFDSYPYGEERRLYYVALTRARKKVFLMCVKEEKSEFVKEIEEQKRKMTE